MSRYNFPPWNVLYMNGRGWPTSYELVALWSVLHTVNFNGVHGKKQEMGMIHV